ncbi:hypothetical protein FCK90_14965 [Kocuria coralli]|uniref:histidine kinase n=1 Tax=Kocuria coralli TaxID=1461025 RepID=A0A5J5KVI8_9MICC|nr:histidine kinase [Kocuria coralli]KAA9392906.1 hypothetical protein FCK90_14965 [Kocuria coralli]
MHHVPPDERLPVIAVRPFPRGQRAVRAVVVAAALVVDLWVWGGDTETWDGGRAPATLIVAVMAASHLCLVLWRSPVPGYAALWLLSLSGMWVPAVETFAGYLVALYLMARMTDRHVAVAALMGSVVPIAANTASGASFHENVDAVFLLMNSGLWVLLMLSVWGVGRVIARSDLRLTTERRWAEETTAEALAMERLRLSRELHDIVAHSLTGIVLQSAGARAGLVRGTAQGHQVEEALQNIQTAAEQSMRELHRLLGMLREPGQPDAQGDGIEQVDGLIATARASGLDVVVRTSGDPLALDPSIAHTVYRVVQEGLSNAMKHSGDGSRVEVTTDWAPETLAVSVMSTSGLSSPAAPSGGFGLVGLRERVVVSGGTFEAGPTAQGFLLHTTLPAAGQHRIPVEKNAEEN